MRRCSLRLIRLMDQAISAPPVAITIVGAAMFQEMPKITNEW